MSILPVYIQENQERSNWMHAEKDSVEFSEKIYPKILDIVF